MDTQHYEDNLKHVVRPEPPHERKQAPRIGLPDHAALWLARALREYAAYVGDEDECSIAWAYVEYIERCIREEGKHYVTVYAHTEAARNVLVEATNQSTTDRLSTDVRGAVTNDVIALHADPDRAADGDYE